jgi:3-oxoadipate enol-lactonase
MPQIQHGEISLHYEWLQQDGMPVLMLSNSLGTTHEMWEPQMKAFARQFQVLRYDMRGHGRSSRGSQTGSIELLGRDVLALLDALELPQVHFCGLSIGGAIGQWLAVQAPTRISKLLLCNTAAKIGNTQGWNDRIEIVKKQGMQAIVEGGLARWFTAGFLASGASMVETMRAMLSQNDPAGYIAGCEAVRDMDQRDTAPAIKSPTCIVAGEFDNVTSLADAQWLHEWIPGAKLVVLPTAHISNVEVPELFSATVLDFLENSAEMCA